MINQEHKVRKYRKVNSSIRSRFTPSNFPALKILRTSLHLLDKKSQKNLKKKMIMQAFLGLLDFVGVALIGVLGAIAVSGIESSNQKDPVRQINDFLGLTRFDFQTQVAIVGITACSVLIVRTILSIVITRRALNYLAKESSQLGKMLMRQSLEKGMVFLESKERSHLLFAFTDAINHLISGVIGAALVLASDISVLIIMSVGLLFFSPILAVSSLIFFLLVAAVLHRILSKEAKFLGSEGTRLRININNNSLDMLNSLRELLALGRIQEFLDRIQNDRVQLAKNTSALSFMPNVSKYVLESSVVIGGLILGAQQFLRHDAVHAITTLSVFIAAGSRIVPSLLRVQQNFLNISTNGNAGLPALALLIPQKPISQDFRLSTTSIAVPSFTPEVNINNLNFKYPKNSNFSLQDISLKIKYREMTAFVGPSGSGKSTLVDLILGILHPDSGSIQINGIEVQQLKAEWPNSISYVPQRVHLVQGDIYSNVAIGVNPKDIDKSAVSESLAKVGLLDFLEDSDIGDSRGKKLNLSGGQLQRIGIARALYVNPKLIILDEATSALDAQTENQITNVLDSLRGEVTLIVVAHRLSTVMKADKVCYFDSGKLLAAGKFAELRSKIPNFDKQAKLMGL